MLHCWVYGEFIETVFALRNLLSSVCQSSRYAGCLFLKCFLLLLCGFKCCLLLIRCKQRPRSLVGEQSRYQRHGSICNIQG